MCLGWRVVGVEGGGKGLTASKFLSQLGLRTGCVVIGPLEQMVRYHAVYLRELTRKWDEQMDGWRVKLQVLWQESP